MDFLATAAVLAIGEMLLVILAHFGRQTGDIVAPSRKDFPHDRFYTLAHNKQLRMSECGLQFRLRLELQPDGFQSLGLGRKQQTVLPQPLTSAEGMFSRRSRDFGMIILFRKMRQD